MIHSKIFLYQDEYPSSKPMDITRTNNLQIKAFNIYFTLSKQIHDNGICMSIKELLL